MVRLAAKLKPSASESEDFLKRLGVPELTPRSSLACKLHAVDPRELLPLVPETFNTPGETEEEHRLRYAAHEAARVQTYRLVQGERERILAGEVHMPTLPLRRPSLESGSLSPLRTSSSTSKLLDVPVTVGMALDMERNRRVLEKMRIRQRDDIEMMLLNELRVTKKLEEEREYLVRVREEEERRQRERKQRAKALALARLTREREQEAAEKEEIARKRRASVIDLARQAGVERRREAESKAAAKEASRREIELYLKKEERLRQEEKALEKRQDEQLLKAKEAWQREAERLQRFEQKRQQAVAENARERRRALERVSVTVTAREAHLREVREQRERRMEQEERRRARAREDLRVEVEARKRAAEEKVRRAQSNRVELGQEVAESIRHMDAEEQRKSEVVQSRQEEKRQAVRSKALWRDLRHQAHARRAERRSRRDEYQREAVFQKTKMDTQRATDTIRTREEATLRCKLMRDSATMRKDIFAQQIEDMKSSTGFALPAEVRNIVQNEELREFLRRYDEIERQLGEKSVPKTVVARLVRQMEAEGALHLDKQSRGAVSSSVPGSPTKRPQSAPPPSMDAASTGVVRRPESAAQSNP